MTRNGLPYDDIANCMDYVEVSICFEDDGINQLFADLFEVRGVKTHILRNILEFMGDTKLVTEPQFYSLLGEEHRSKCLLVGNKEALKGLHAISLSRPLTEVKVESALNQFLKA